MIIHTVRAGETIYSIANNYGVSESLLSLNNGIDGPLVVGEELVVLFPSTIHTVDFGETLQTIADKYSISVREVFRNNYYLRGNENIYPGQTLVISYTDNPTKRVRTHGYAYPFVNEQVLRTSMPYVDYLTPFTYGLTYNGNLLNLDDERLINIAKEYGTKAAMHISTLDESDRFDSNLASNILSNPDLQEILYEDVRRVAKEKGYSAIDIDFEYINGSESEEYANFVAKLRTLGYPVIVAAAPKTSATQKGQLYEGHNYRLLGQAADYLFVMTYEWGYTYGPPLPVAPIQNVRRVLDYAVTEVPPEKILLGIPNYGYDWKLPFVQGISRATSIGNRQAVEIAREKRAEIFFDETAQTPYFNYTDASGEHIVWFENARSIKAKFDLVNSYNLAGMGYWNLMREFPQLWLIQNAMFG